MEMRKHKGAAALFFIFFFYACTTAPFVDLEQESVVKPLPTVQSQLVDAAYWAKGRKSLTVRGKSFAMDCTGVVLAAYYYAGIDLAKDFDKYKGNGVKRLYFYLEENALLYQTRLPAPGDVIFWDNTYDSNENGLIDDELTHVGIIVTMNQNSGQGTYLHYNYAKGITIEKVNLMDPDNPAVNAPIRMRALPKVDGYKYMSSQLIQDLARAYELDRDIVD